jgi:hypothetical protein
MVVQPVIPVLGKLKEEDQEFKISLGPGTSGSHL